MNVDIFFLFPSLFPDFGAWTSLFDVLGAFLEVDLSVSWDVRVEEADFVEGVQEDIVTA